MNQLVTFGFSCLLSMAVPCAGQTFCEASVPGTVEAAHVVLSLADLLAPGSCRAIVQAASEVRLGGLPLAGSVRVFEGADIRALLESVAGGFAGVPRENFRMKVPERIRVRRRGSRMSCAEIGKKVFHVASPEIECGAPDRIPSDAPLAVARKVWNPAARSWDMIVRCSHPDDCVPFAVQRPETDPAAAGLGGSRQPLHRDRTATVLRGTSSLASGETILVHRGEAATLIWDQEGIRVAMAAICLDSGGRGNVVRARVARAGRVFRAVVVGPGKLRVQS